LGEQQALLGPDKGNPIGHFEHKGFKQLDESLLAHFGGSTDNPPELEPSWQHNPSLHTALEEARSLLATFKGKTVWGWKDPRTTLVIPFWKQLIGDARFVVCIRNPLEVATSIAARDGMPFEKGFYLWNRYTRAAIRDTEGCARIFTFYDDYFANGLSEINRVATFCGLGMPMALSTLQTAIHRELRHHSCSLTDLLKCASAPTGYKLLYVGLRAISLTGGMTPQASAEDEISENAGAFVRSMDEFEQQEQLANSQELLLKKDYELVELRSRLERLVEDNTRLQQFSDAVRQTLVYRMYRKLIRVRKRQSLSLDG
jgi:hypothetical protein